MMEFFEYMGISFASSVVLLILSKIIMSHMLRRDKNFYEKTEAAEEAQLLEGVKLLTNSETKGGEENDVK